MVMSNSLVQMSIVISTRNRDAEIGAMIRAVLASRAMAFHVIVVDQSDDAKTQVALREFADDARLRVITSPTRGVACGRNVGIAAAMTELVACTDDDCVPAPDWLSEMLAAFAVDSQIALVFGNVNAAPCDARQGVIPSYTCDAPFLARTMRDKHHVEGIGACMGLRKSVWAQLRGFDEQLGVGARFGAGEETDFAMRVLRAGYALYETPRVSVTHFGFRTWETSAALAHTYWLGTGAVFAKHLRCRHWAVIPLLMRIARRWLVGHSRVAAGLPRSRKLDRLFAFGAGFCAGMRTPLDYATQHFSAR